MLVIKMNGWNIQEIRLWKWDFWNESIIITGIWNEPINQASEDGASKLNKLTFNLVQNSKQALQELYRVGTYTVQFAGGHEQMSV